MTSKIGLLLRNLFLSIIFVLVVAVVNSRATSPPPITHLFTTSDVVVTGILIHVRIEPVLPPSKFNVALRFRVEHFWKGSDDKEFTLHLQVYDPTLKEGEVDIYRHYKQGAAYAVFYNFKREAKSDDGNRSSSFLLRMRSDRLRDELAELERERKAQ